MMLLGYTRAALGYTKGGSPRQRGCSAANYQGSGRIKAKAATSVPKGNFLHQIIRSVLKLGRLQQPIVNKVRFAYYTDKNTMEIRLNLKPQYYLYCVKTQQQLHNFNYLLMCNEI